MSRLSRRGFLKMSGAAAGSLLLGCDRTPPSTWATGQTDDNAEFDAWLAITPEGRILVHAHKVEMGQGTYTAFATLVGEELHTPPQHIEIVSAPVHEAFGAPFQGTGGSGSLKAIWQPLRETGARAREMLKAAAADRWNTTADALEVEDRSVRNPATGEILSFGALALAAATRPSPQEVTLTPPERWRYIGTEFPRVDAAEKVCGRARYGMDVMLPDQLTAVVVHCPHPLGSLLSFDGATARDQPGIENVFEVPDGVAIIGTDYWSARSAAGRLVVSWDAGGSRGVDSASIHAGLANALDRGEMHSARDDGNTQAAFDESSQIIEAEYSLPYLAHATMEPMNCTVAPRADGCDVYVGSQSPASVQDAVAAELGLSRANVRVHNQFLGGGFGRRFFVDMAAEAAHIAHRIGRPIKLVWSREDDMARDYYRPASLHRLRASLSASGTPQAWEHKLAAPSLLPHMAGAAAAAVPSWLRSLTSSIAEGVARRVTDWTGPLLAIEGARDLAYSIPSVSVGATAWDPGIPVGIWRSVGHSHNGFVVESFIDELAHAAASDPAQYRRRLLAEQPRHLRVLDALLEAAGWGHPRPGHYQGIALHESFDSVVGQVAEVSVEGATLRVHRVTCVIDCGLAVNPDIVKAQMESAIHFGLTAALYGEIHFEDGAAVESNFHDHRMLRMADAPDTVVHIVSSDRPPSGVGEPGTPPIAPAVANAVFAATGKRLRALPLKLG